ncbi:hypothetical protein DPMN_096984 [Dreissena polymorpha]|uniref:Uncharacterized protein n=1 Tax=Dreissena polymorpha TaxID=45954 RepID=A0A9D4LC48_DREPO|nr:hypothetical protein DPMN_096984 [Dreissena polymorpha]
MTEANKRKKWQEIVAAINACGVALRTADTFSQTGGSPAGDSQTVCDLAKAVWAPAGYSKTVCDGANTVSAPEGDFQTVFEGARRQSLRPAGHLQQTPRQSATLPDSHSDRRGTCSRLPDSL